jgi:hypothetical protein
MRLCGRTIKGTFGLICIASLAGLAGIGSAKADSIVAASYSYTGGTPAGEPGYSFYTDPSDTKLTDGLTGTTWGGDGSWVGFQHSDSGAAQITFNFASSVTITDVSIDFLRSDAANTELPENVQIASTVFPTTNFPVDVTKGFVDYSGSWTGSQLVVTLEHSTDHWVALNEIQFSGSADSGAVPEPGTVGLALAGLVAVIGWGRKRNYFIR